MFIFLTFFSFFVLLNNSNAQISALISKPDTINEQNLITFSADKLVSTYLFTGGANIYKELFGGIFSLTQAYAGSSIRSIKNNFRDDESLHFSYSYPILKSLEIITKQNWLYSSDTKDIQLNKFERLNGLVGLKANYLESSGTEILIGAEKNQQVGIKSSGMVLSGRSSLNDLNVSDYIINSDIYGDYSRLDFSRINSNLDSKISVLRNYDSLNGLRFNFRYKLLNADYYNPPFSNAGPDFAFENRYERRLFSELNLNFSVSKYIQTTLTSSYGVGDVTRNYRNISESAAITKIKKLVNDNHLFLQGETRVVLDIFQQNFGLSFESHTEENSMKKKVDITPAEESYLAGTEFFPDYSSSRTRLFSRSRLSFSPKDAFQLDYYVSLYQYDTPSKLNNDDKDEYSTMTSLAYTRRQSEYVNIMLRAELIMNHLVFLKAVKSSQNSWNRIIRFSPQIYYTLNGFSMQPQLEILANYTDYDFSEISAALRNFTSLRQISYKDSIFIDLGQNFSLHSRLLYRYSERGILFWDQFAESPQNSNFEQFAKLLLFVNLNSRILVGVGARYYFISQNNLVNQTNRGIPDYELFSYGPETNIRILLLSGSEISFQGWYDFQLINKKEKLIVPNFMLHASIRL